MKIYFPFLFACLMSTRLFAWAFGGDIKGFYESGAYNYKAGLILYHNLVLTSDSFKLTSTFGSGTPINIYVNHSVVKKGAYRLINDTLQAYDKPGSIYAIFKVNSIENALSIIKLNDTAIKLGINEKTIYFYKDGEVYPNGIVKIYFQLEAADRHTRAPVQFRFITYDTLGNETSRGEKRNGFNIGVSDTSITVQIQPFHNCWGSYVEGKMIWGSDGSPEYVHHRFRLGRWRNGRKVGIWKYYITSGTHQGERVCGSYYTMIDYKIRMEKYSYKRGLIWSKIN